jgi:hypothetical protein
LTNGRVRFVLTSDITIYSGVFLKRLFRESFENVLLALPPWALMITREEERDDRIRTSNSFVPNETLREPAIPILSGYYNTFFHKSPHFFMELQLEQIP